MHIESCLKRIEDLDTSISAFVAYDPVAARKQILHQNPNLPLSGVALGVKDIIDAVPFATGCGSPIHANTRPAQDASCVAALRNAGATVIGKTVTTEFAFFSPGATRNPHDHLRTPGGSSSGSAAAVAAGFIDVGLGSQTAASITRPASFCGVVGFKPSFGTYSLTGVKEFAPSFDTLGTLARDVKSITAVHEVLASAKTASTHWSPAPARRIGVCRTADWMQAETGTKIAIATATRILLREAEVIDVDMTLFADAPQIHAAIMAFEARQSLKNEVASQPDLISKVLRNLLLEGEKITSTEHRCNLKRAEEFRKRASELTATYDLLIAPAAVGEAPLGLEATGDPIFSRLWTLLRLPTITLPGFTGPNGMPVGIQLLSAIHDDERLLQHAMWAEQLFPKPTTLDLGMSRQRLGVWSQHMMV